MPPRAAPRAAARRSLIASGEVVRAAALVMPAGSAIAMLLQTPLDHVDDNRGPPHGRLLPLETTPP
jgi:hypothetical protein